MKRWTTVTGGEVEGTTLGWWSGARGPLGRVGVRGRAWARTVVPWRERARRARADVCEARGVEQEGGSHTNGRGAALVSTGLTNRFMEKRMETRLL